jgi:hypothetical protein
MKIEHLNLYKRILGALQDLSYCFDNEDYKKFIEASIELKANTKFVSEQFKEMWIDYNKFIENLDNHILSVINKRLRNKDYSYRKDISRLFEELYTVKTKFIKVIFGDEALYNQNLNMLSIPEVDAKLLEAVSKTDQEICIEKAMKEWQNRPKIELAICFIIYFFIVTGALYYVNWNPEEASKLIKDNIIIWFGITVLTLVISGFGIASLVLRTRNESNIKTYRDKLRDQKCKD